ncbi:MAG: glycosyltransferase [Pseudonocardia sp.]|nr:glycosyltransferase [Pseudonocardia sp.]
MGGLLGAVVFLGLGLWGAHHIGSVLAAIEGNGTQFGLLFSVAFAMLAVQTVLYHLERPVRVTRRQQRNLDELAVVVAVPAYNEDPELLLRCLLSMLRQRRLPDLVFVVDDGSHQARYGGVQAEFEQRARAAGVATRWARTPNAGKRHAQGLVFSNTPIADVYVTVDSDAYLDHEAIHEVLKPFRDPDVQSVAGVVLASNVAKNLLTRITDLWFVTGQMVDRSAASVTGSVLVNSGPLAAYRAAVVRDNLDGYLHETFFGRRVEFSDDSMLTIYALARGKAVQQPTAFALTAMPETLDHHVRQYLRWMRGATIRSWWRFKYLPLSGPAFWLHLMGWVQMAVSTALFVILFVIAPVAAGKMTPLLLLVPVSVGVAQAMRYLNIRRSDQSAWSTIATLALAPVGVLWAFFGLRVIRWYGMATCLRTGSWGTRETIELRAEPKAATAA